MNVTELQPSLLKASLSNGVDLKASITTSSYAGGIPAAAAEVKPGLLDSFGNLKASMVDVSGSALKAGLLK